MLYLPQIQKIYTSIQVVNQINLLAYSDVSIENQKAANFENDFRWRNERNENWTGAKEMKWRNGNLLICSPFLM